ncbi:hypothetical protein LEN26_011001 [Aphanomyces euteiches]|nr:hypothetical protein LEN26_011001 [Aphanomyces euteiches]
MSLPSLCEQMRRAVRWTSIRGLRSQASAVAYVESLQDSIAAHTRIIFPEAPSALQCSHERPIPTYRNEPALLHEMSTSNAAFNLTKSWRQGIICPRNAYQLKLYVVGMLWQEAQDLNASRQHDRVINVLYRKIYLNPDLHKLWTPRTSSLFAQQLVLAATATNNASIAIEAFNLFTSLPAHVISRKVLHQIGLAVVHVCLDQANSSNDYLPILNCLQHHRLPLDENLTDRVMKDLLANEDHAAITSLKYIWNASLPVHTNVLWSLVAQGDSAGVDALYNSMKSQNSLDDADGVNYLLRQSCHSKDWDHVGTILDWMQAQQFVASVPATIDLCGVLVSSDDHDCLVQMFDQYDQVLPWTTQHVSVAISAAAIHGQSEAALALLNAANDRNLSILDVTYGHVAATSRDTATRAEFVRKYKAARRAYTVTIAADQANADAAGFHVSGALLQHAAASQDIDPAVAMMFLDEMQYYGVEATEDDMRHALARLSPDVLSLYGFYEKFPRVVKNAPVALAKAISVSILPKPLSRATLDDAVRLWRCFVWTEAILLDETVVFPTLYYVTLRETNAHLANEVKTQFQTRHQELDSLLEGVLGVCANEKDFDTLQVVLRQWPSKTELTLQAVDYVFETIQKLHHDNHSTPTYFGTMVAYPGLFPLTRDVLNQALILSAEAGHFYNCQALIAMANANTVPLKHAARLACVALLEKTSSQDIESKEGEDRKQLLDTVRQHWSSLHMKPAFVEAIKALR